MNGGGEACSNYGIHTNVDGGAIPKYRQTVESFLIIHLLRACCHDGCMYKLNANEELESSYVVDTINVEAKR
jgi:hypothetical protein